MERMREKEENPYEFWLVLEKGTTFILAFLF